MFTAASGDTKTGQARTVVLPAAVAEELSAHIAQWSDWKPDTLIFQGERGAILDGGNFRRPVFGPAAQRAAFNHGLRVNDLRHSAVSFAVAHGANVYAVERMVGHSKVSITLDVTVSCGTRRRSSLPRSWTQRSGPSLRRPLRARGS